MLPDDTRLKDARRTAAIDRPLEKDPYGNAIVAAIGGGIVAGVRVAAAEALAPSAGVQSVMLHVGAQVAKGIATATAKTAVTSTFSPEPEAAASASERPASPAPDERRSEPAPAGRSSPKRTSEVVPEPNQSLALPHPPLVIQG